MPQLVAILKRSDGFAKEPQTHSKIERFTEVGRVDLGSVKLHLQLPHKLEIRQGPNRVVYTNYYLNTISPMDWDHEKDMEVDYLLTEQYFVIPANEVLPAKKETITTVS